MTSDLIIILNLILLESLLSVDNAAVLAAMVQPLPANERSKALKYGIIGAYVLRGASLFAAAYLIKFLWLKIVGGAYLVYLGYSFFKQKNTPTLPDEDPTDDNWYTRNVTRTKNAILRKIGLFWATVFMVEMMDLAFSLDNILACVAFTKSFALICVGVFIGIFVMRLVANTFVKLMQKYPSLEKSTYIVILALGFKLILTGNAPIIDKTPSKAGERGNEIDAWLEGKNVKSYVVLDDGTDFHEHQKPYFVNTDFMVGLSEQDAERAISILCPAST